VKSLALSEERESHTVEYINTNQSGRGRSIRCLTATVQRPWGAVCQPAAPCFLNELRSPARRIR
jgi:hypothetical protein